MLQSNAARTIDIEKSLGNIDELWAEVEPVPTASQLKAKKCELLRVMVEYSNPRTIEKLLKPGTDAPTLQELLVDSLAFNVAVDHNKLPAAKKLLELAPDDETRKHMIMLKAVAAFNLATINNDYSFMGSLLDLAEDDDERRHMVVSANFSKLDTTAIKGHPELVNRLLQLAKSRPDVQENILTPTRPVASATAAAGAGVAYVMPHQQQGHILSSSPYTPTCTHPVATVAPAAGVAYGMPHQQQGRLLTSSSSYAPTWTRPVASATAAAGVVYGMPHHQQGYLLASSYLIPTFESMGWNAQSVVSHSTRNPRKNRRGEERVRCEQPVYLCLVPIQMISDTYRSF